MKQAGRKSTLKMEATCSSETYVGFHGLQGVISHNIEFLITTAVKTSNPAVFLFVPLTNILILQ
jgi:hypothetical protein